MKILCPWVYVDHCKREVIRKLDRFFKKLNKIFKIKKHSRRIQSWMSVVENEFGWFGRQNWKIPTRTK